MFLQVFLFLFDFFCHLYKRRKRKIRFSRFPMKYSVVVLPTHKLLQMLFSGTYLYLARFVTIHLVNRPRYDTTSDAIRSLSCSIIMRAAFSRATCSLIFSQPCLTVLWSRPPKTRPISSNELPVITFAKYMPT